jgi:hypothetical protein
MEQIGQKKLTIKEFTEKYTELHKNALEKKLTYD